MPGEWCDGFLQLVKSGQPVVGESTDQDYPESIEVLSFKFGNTSGFGDTGESSAAKKVGEPRGVAMSQGHQSDGSIGLGSSFAGEDETPESSKKELDQSQGKDLSEVGSCSFQITKEMDISSPDLFRAYCSAQDLDHRDVFDSATLTLRKATGKTRAAFLTYTFSDLVVTGYSLEIGGDASPKETISLSFAKIRAMFRPQKATGALSPVIKGGWDFIARGSW